MADQTEGERRLLVRGRPVGYVPGAWGGSLVALERGYFPISETGYRSLSGLNGSAVTEGFLEALARERDRERQRLVVQVHGPVHPDEEPLMNYIHVSGLANRAFQQGIFARDTERADLWSGAHRLYALVAGDARFHPAAAHPHWSAEHCAQAAGAMKRRRLCFLKGVLL